MTEEIERIRIGNISLKTLLNPKFISKLEELKEDITPAYIILIKTKDKIPIPIIIGHQNKKEVEDKIAHIESPEQDLLSKIRDVIKQM